MDNGDNTASYTPTGMAPGTYMAEFSYLCSDATTIFRDTATVEILGMPSALDITPNTLCNVSNASILSLVGTDIPQGDEFITWSSTSPLITFNDNLGSEASIDATGVPAGTYQVCVDVTSGTVLDDLGQPCFAPVMYCEDIMVTAGPPLPTSVEIDIACALDESGEVALSELFFGFTNDILANATYTVTGPGLVVGGALVYNGYGCVEVQAVGNSGEPCFVDFDITSYVFITEQPEPLFSMPDQACWSVGDPANLVTPVVGSPAYTGTVVESWAMSGTDITNGDFNTTDGSFTIGGTGTMTVTLTETITTTAGNCTGATTCSATYEQVITVEDGTATDPVFSISANPICAGDVAVLTATNAGGIFTGLGVTDDGNGMTGSFTSATPGIYDVTYTLNSPNGCTSTYTLSVQVYGAVDASLNDLHIECVTNPSGNIALTSLFTGTTTAGGTFTLVAAGTTGVGTVSGNTLTYTTAGCYEVQYVADAYAGASGACADTQNGFILISEEPQPSFDIQDQICWSAADVATHLYTPVINSPVYDNPVTETWTVISGPATINDPGTGEILVSGPGEIILQLEEDIPYDACGTITGGSCTEISQVTINVEDGTSQNAAFTIDIMNPCVGETVTLTPTIEGGYFSGVGVVNNVPGVEGQFTPPSCGTFVVSYVLNSPNGCSAIYSLNITTDLTPPTIDTPPADLTVECDGLGNSAALDGWLMSQGGGVASDNCAGTLVWEYDLVAFVDDCGNAGTYTYRFTVTDVCGRFCYCGHNYPSYYGSR